MRHTCDPILRTALYYAARAASARRPVYADMLAEKRSAGLGYARALRSISQKQARILFAMLRNNSLYDEIKISS